MNLLDAFLALALTMLVLATIATTLVEILQRVLNSRVHGLESMLTSLVEEEVQPLVDPKGSVTPEAFALDLIPKAEKCRQRFGIPGLRSRTSKSSNLSLEDFLRRLGGTPAGRLFVLTNKERLPQFASRISSMFREYEKLSSDLFRRRAQLISALMGIALAVAARVDAVELFDHYLRDDSARAEMIGRLEQITEGVQDVEPTEASMQELQALLPQDLPIGWEAEDDVTLVLLLRLLLTGVLIGLGSPFWFDAVRALAAVRGGKEPDQDDAGAASDPAPVTGKREAALLGEAVATETREHGREAREAWDTLAATGGEAARKAFRAARRELAAREAALIDNLERLRA